LRDLYNASAVHECNVLGYTSKTKGLYVEEKYLYEQFILDYKIFGCVKD